mmetsp:Transcript_19626/g.56483  ORF Transcript_19626/g.56483 Transcript_19626/m.56483 type:complete len:105 (+) Transcript_19626:1380-1694(+)
MTSDVCVCVCDTRSTVGNLDDKDGEGTFARGWTVKACAVILFMPPPPPTLFRAIAETERAAADTKLAIPQLLVFLVDDERLRRLRTMDAGSVSGIWPGILFMAQ